MGVGALLAAGFFEILVGGYTPEGAGQGIASIRMNLETGELSAPKLLAEIANPSYLVQHPTLPFIYAVQEFSAGRITAFRRESDGSLSRIADTDFDGGGPCHLFIDSTGQALLASAYGGGAVASFRISSDGRLWPVSRFAFQGKGPNPRRQEAPHTHFAAVHPLGRIAYAVDLGTDSIQAFEFSPQTAALSPLWSRQTAPGAGPRHLAISLDGASVYALNELNCTVTRYECNERSGWLEPRQTLSTLPPGAAREGSTGAAIHLSPNGRHLYASNRGHDSIAVFEIGPKGDLAFMEALPLGLKTPRSFAIDPSGRWLVAAGQGSNEIASYRLDPISGRFEPSGSRVSHPSPTKVAFMH
jgi:6-phosphogluconolactonase